MLLGIGLIGYTTLQAPTVVPVDVIPIQNYVETCLHDTLQQGDALIAIQGGHIVLPNPHLVTNYGAIAYAMRDRRVSLPSVEEMELELEAYIQDVLPTCTGNYSEFQTEGFDIQAKSITADVTIKGDSVSVYLEYPLTITLNNVTSSLERFTVERNDPLLRAHASVAGVVLKTVQDPNWIDLTYLSDFEGKIDILPHNDTSFVYSVTYPGPFVFLAGVEFTPNNPPVITMEDTISIPRDRPFNRQVQVSDDEDVTCTDNTAMFDITDECYISFTPRVNGEYKVSIYATDELDARTEHTVTFVVG